MHRIALVLGVALLLTGCVKFGDQTSLIDDEAAVATAISAMQSRFSGPVRVLKLSIADSEMIIQTRHPLERDRIVEWRLTRERFLFVSWDSLDGPNRADPVLINPKIDENLFDLKDVDLTSWGRVADAAIARVALEGKGGVSRVELSRAVYLLPERASGAVRWTIEVRSQNESATVYADTAGNITRVNLANTARMRNLKMYQRPELMADAARDFVVAVGRGPVLTRVSFSQTSIGFDTAVRDDSHPMAAGTSSLRATAAFTWSPEGLQRTLGRINVSGAFSNENAPFSADDIDWDLLPKLVTDARAKLGMADANVIGIDLTKPTDGVGTAIPLWKIELEANRERGSVSFDAKGAVKKISLPPSRRPPTQWLAPATVSETLSRIDKEFGPQAKFNQIMIHDTQVVIQGEDPRKPGELTRVLLKDDGFQRFGTAWTLSIGGPFTMKDIAGLSEQRIAELVDRTLDKLKMRPGSVFRITIGRGSAMFGERNLPLTVEIRAEEKGAGSGWVIFKLDGSIHEVMQP